MPKREGIGPALAAELGGEFDLDNAAAILPNGDRIICKISGRVFVAGGIGAFPYFLGTTADPVAELAARYRALRASLNRGGKYARR